MDGVPHLAQGAPEAGVTDAVPAILGAAALVLAACGALAVYRRAALEAVREGGA